ncbi:MAG: DNA primase [Betaproteobacteria bacterium]|nr:DNA primase [Betaproteobacteria bacterium]
MIPESFKQDLLNRVDIVEVIERHVRLKKSGANYVACCPFHTEKTPSFTVSQAKQFYHCFGCGVNGNAISFLMEYQGLGYVEAVTPGWQNLEAVFPGYQDKALRDCGLVIDGEGDRRYDRFRDRIMFPILNQRGTVIGFGGRVLGQGEPKYLNSPETALFEKGRELYGLPQARAAIRASAKALVVEGYLDVVALAQHGIEFAVATLGTATSAAHVQKLLRQTDEIVFCFDGDAAGRRAAWHALEVSLPLLADHKAVKFLFLPSGHDPDSFVRERGRDAFERMLAETRLLSEFLLDELKSRADADTVEGRSRLIHEAKPLLKRIGAPALQLQMVKQLADVARITQEEAARLTEIPIAAARGFPRIREAAALPSKARGWHQPQRSLYRKLLCGLLVAPTLREEVPLGELDPTIPEAQAISALAEIWRAQAALDVESAIACLSVPEHAEIVKVVRASLLDIPMQDEAREKEFHDAIRALRAQRPNPRLKELERKDASAGLSEQEADEYRRLIREDAALKQSRSSQANVLKF